MKCGPVTFAPGLRSDFPGDIIDIRLQIPGMLEGMSRFLLQLLSSCHDFNTLYDWKDISWGNLNPLGLIDVRPSSWLLERKEFR